MHSKTAQLLRAVAQLVDKFGLVGAVGLLNSLSDINAHSTTELRNFVVALTCAEFQIKKSDLASKRNLGGKRTDALKVAAFILVKHAKLSQKEVSLLLGKDKSAISKYLQEVAQLNERITPDAALLNKLHAVENRFLTTIQTQPNDGDKEAQGPTT